MSALVRRILLESIDVKRRSLELAGGITTAGETLVRALLAGNKVLVCGNGGSAADAQHFAAELVCRFEAERRELPCIALTTDSSILTAWSNDASFETVFSRQIRALGRPDDVLIGISTSGNSPNVLMAMEAAAGCGMSRVTLSGRGGGRLAALADAQHVVVPSDVTARIQEVHLLVLHAWCRMIDKAFSAP
jgi:D-sedoheptulose 7-phosphate isomerase